MHELSEALTAIAVAGEAYRRWMAAGEGRRAEADAAMAVMIEGADRLRRFADARLENRAAG